MALKVARLTNLEIARDLALAESTVKWYVRQIYNKLGVNNREELLVRAQELELVDGGHAAFARPLPTPLTPFVGRETEVEALLELLRKPYHRLITITGPGGIGKTRLAMRTAELAADSFDDGLCWVPFAVHNPTEFGQTAPGDVIISGIADGLGLAIQPHAEPLQQLVHHLRNQRTLLVLDGCEHLVSGAETITDLLEGTVSARVLVTSRERLGLPGETLRLIGGLTVPDVNNLKEARVSDAVKLFVESANFVSPSFMLNARSATSAARISRQLEGMPLAIELAASWMSTLSVGEIADELGEGFSLLRDRSHRVEAVFGRSWVLLAEEQKVAFARLSIFRGGFDRKAAETATDVKLRTLIALRDKSLVERSGPGRYRIHDLLREYAADKLADIGEATSVGDAHCEYFANYVDERSFQIFGGEHQEILAELDNVRAAWSWANHRRNLTAIGQMLWPMQWFYDLRGRFREAAADAQAAVDALRMAEPEGRRGFLYGLALANHGIEKSRYADSRKVRGQVREGLDVMHRLGAADELAYTQAAAVLVGVFRDPQEAEQRLFDCLAMFDDTENLHGIAFTETLLGGICAQLGKEAEGLEHAEKALKIMRTLGDPEGIAYATRQLAALAFQSGRYEDASRHSQAAAEGWRSLGLRRPYAEELSAAGRSLQLMDRLSEAQKLHRESLTIFEEFGDQRNMALSLYALAQLAAVRRELAKAKNLLEAAESIFRERQEQEELVGTLSALGFVCIQLEQGAAAQRQLREGLLTVSKTTPQPVLLDLLSSCAHLELFEGRPERSGVLLGLVDDRPQIAIPLQSLRLDLLRDRLAEALPAKALAAAQESGSRLDPHAGVDMLLAEAALN